MEPLYINILLYFLTFLFYFFKDRTLGVRECVFLLYAIFGVASVVSINDGVYFETFGVYAFHQLSIMPLLLNYLFVLLFAQSLNGLSKVKFDLISFDNVYVRIFEWSMILIAIINLVFQYLWSQIFGELELSDVYYSGHTGDSELTFDNQLWNILFYRSKQIIAIATPIIYIIEFMNLTLNKHVKKSALIIILIFLSAIIGHGLSGNRGGIVFAFASLAFFVILFWPKLSKSIKRTVVIALTGLIGLGMVYIIAISISRFDETDYGAGNAALRYFGESYPNFAWQIWTEEGHTLGGMRTFPTLYEMFGGYIPQNDEGFGGSQVMFELISGWPILIFKTFYGDLYVEFGAYIPFLIAIFYLLFVNLMQAKLKYSVFSLLIFHFSFMALIFGLFDNYLTESNIVNLIILFLVAIWFNNKLIKKDIV